MFRGLGFRVSGSILDALGVPLRVVKSPNPEP